MSYPTCKDDLNKPPETGFGIQSILMICPCPDHWGTYQRVVCTQKQHSTVQHLLCLGQNKTCFWRVALWWGGGVHVSQKKRLSLLPSEVCSPHSNRRAPAESPRVEKLCSFRTKLRKQTLRFVFHTRVQRIDSFIRARTFELKKEPPWNCVCTFLSKICWCKIAKSTLNMLLGLGFCFVVTQAF